MTLLDLLIIFLGAHRLWAIWLFLPWAKRAQDRFQAEGRWIDKLQSCEFCLSFWAGILAVGIWLSPYGSYVLVALAGGGFVFVWAQVTNLIMTLTQRQHVWMSAVRLTAQGVKPGVKSE